MLRPSTDSERHRNPLLSLKKVLGTNRELLFEFRGALVDAQKLDEVREALQRGDLRKAGQLARLYQLTPLQV